MQPLRFPSLAVSALRVVALFGPLALLPLVAPDRGAAQAPDGGWRLSAGVGSAWITSGHPYMDDGQRAPTARLAVERRVGRSYAVGVQWIGTWYQGHYGDERRHSLALTGSLYPWAGLFVTAGAGPGTASLVLREGPPADGPGDVLIDVFEGESAFSLTADLGWEVCLGQRFAIAPVLSRVTHWLHDDRMSITALTGRVSVRLP